MKKVLLTLGSLVVLALIFFSLVHNSITDRLNPLIKETTSYAEVKLDTQDYRNVQAYDSKGQPLKYKLKRVGGYDPSQKYISITHKGQYVKSITYVSKNKFMKYRELAE